MDVDLNDPLQILLGLLRQHAQVYPRYRAVVPDATVKLGLDEARAAVAEFGGHVEQSEVWILPGGYELLGPWLPLQDGTPA